MKMKYLILLPRFKKGYSKRGVKFGNSQYFQNMAQNEIRKCYIQLKNKESLTKLNLIQKKKI